MKRLVLVLSAAIVLAAALPALAAPSYSNGAHSAQSDFYCTAHTSSKGDTVAPNGTPAWYSVTAAGGTYSTKGLNKAANMNVFVNGTNVGWNAASAAGVNPAVAHYDFTVDYSTDTIRVATYHTWADGDWANTSMTHSCG